MMKRFSWILLILSATHIMEHNCFVQQLILKKRYGTIVKVIRKIYGESGPVPDFAFLDKEDLVEFELTHEDPTEVATLNRRNVSAKKTDIFEKVFAQSFFDFKRGVNRPFLKRIAYDIIEKLYPNISMSEEHEETTLDSKIDNLKQGISELHSTDEKTKDVEELTDTLQGPLLENFVDDIEDEILTKVNVDKRERRVVGQNDDRKVRRNVGQSINFVEVGTKTCFKKLTTGSDSNSQKLCGYCVRKLDFGPLVIPRFHLSIECDSTDITCLGGDGTCYQRVTEIQLVKLNSDISQVSNQLQQFYHPINISCECECIAGSTFAQILSGL